MSVDAKQRDLFPGALELMILRLVQRRPLHGYALVAEIKQSSGDLLHVEEGSLYMALQRMLKERWLSAKWTVSSTNRRVRVYSITLGAGANTAIFSVIDAVLLRPLPYKDPHQLMFLWEGEATSSSLYSFSYPRFAAFHDQITTFSGLAAYDDEQITYTNRGVPE